MARIDLSTSYRPGKLLSERGRENRGAFFYARNLCAWIFCLCDRCETVHLSFVFNHVYNYLCRHKYGYFSSQNAKICCPIMYCIKNFQDKQQA